MARGTIRGRARQGKIRKRKERKNRERAISHERTGLYFHAQHTTATNVESAESQLSRQSHVRLAVVLSPHSSPHDFEHIHPRQQRLELLDLGHEESFRVMGQQEWRSAQKPRGFREKLLDEFYSRSQGVLVVQKESRTMSHQPCVRCSRQGDKVRCDAMTCNHTDAFDYQAM